jgi:TPR repeat protein
MEYTNEQDRRYTILNCAIVLGSIIGIFILNAPALIAAAQYNMGSRYLHGEGVEIDMGKSAQLMLSSAQKGYADAQYLLGTFYENGVGLSADYEQATHWYELAAQTGNDLASLVLAECDCQSHYGTDYDYELPLYHFWLSARRGNAYAAYHIGKRWENGLNAAQSYENAFSWYNFAAERGAEPAQYSLANFYFNGIGTEQDLEKAVYWYAFSAEQGNPDAQNQFGECYAKGIGAKQDSDEARHWYTLSAKQGNPNAQNQLGLYYAKGESIKQDYGQAAYWFNLSAERGNVDAQNNLGNRYFYGEGIELDYSKAVSWYAKAVENGHEDALVNLGYCYYNGLGIAANSSEALDLWGNLAERGNGDARNFITALATSPVPATRVSIEPNANLEEPIGIGTVIHLAGIVEPYNATNTNVTWSSSDESIATVTQARKGDLSATVEGIAAGNAVITVTTEDGNHTLDIPITVLPHAIPVSGITILESAGNTISVGETKMFEGTVLPMNAANRNCFYQSNNEHVATVDGIFVTGVLPGIATITITTEEGDYTAKYIITVLSQPISVKGIYLSNDKSMVRIGEEKHMNETVLPHNASDKEVVWSSSDESIATIDNGGRLIGVAEGIATITAMTIDGDCVAHGSVTVLQKWE